MESDFSAIHRIDDMYALEVSKFFSLANRLASYKGVIRARAQAEAEEQESPRSNSPATYGEPVKEIAATPMAFAADPGLAGLVEFK